MGLFGNKKHSIGKTIAELRKEKGWTQIELAEKLQVSDKAISKWEKDSGAPSVEFFPALAELFGVSIDYIMTGNKPEPKIITMSKIELCAKKDDVQLFNSLNDDVLAGKDDNGNTILDYILKYKCKKIATALFAKYSAKTIISQNCTRNSKFCFWNTEKVLELLIRNNFVKELEDLEVFSTRFYGDRRRDKSGSDYVSDIYTAKYRKIILTDNDISSELKIKYFQSCTAQQIVDCLNDLIELNDKKQIEMLWDIVKAVNEKNIAGYEERKKETYSGSQVYVRYTNIPDKVYETIGTSCNYYFFVVTVPVDTIEKLLNKNYVDIARQANEFNAKIGAAVLNEEKFSLVKAKIEGNVNKKDLTILKVTKNGILDIDELLATKDFKLIKEILLNNPIHIVELLYNWLKAGKMKELFKYAVDNNLNLLADNIIKSNDDKIKTEFVNLFKKNLTSQGNLVINGKPIDVRGKRLNIYSLTIDQIIDYLLAYKQQIISDTSYELDKEKTISELTKEYFEAELAKGNAEIVIVKLCVRLEAILRSSYHYMGDFSEMLNNYCNAYGQEDDGWGYNQEAKFVGYLQKLRKCRNSIVHSEKTQEKLSLDEIRFCIGYICNMK